MDMHSPRELALLYRQGKNITQLMRDERGLIHNSNEIIEISYDLQAGSYIESMGEAWMAEHNAEYCQQLAKVILSLCNPDSILEAGIGEATTLADLLPHLSKKISSYGFDISWSRVAYGKQWLQQQGIYNTVLCTGNLCHIPFADNAVELVYTSHSLEPNGGNEAAILKELYRVASKFLVLLEPGYELANKDAKHRMEQHGYCRNIKSIAQSLGYRILLHEFFPSSVNPLNPTVITIIEKPPSFEPAKHILACPKYKTPLENIENMLFSPESLMVYPIVGGIPCLGINNGLVASKFRELISKG
jgi:ubiquinone/menaquinone biosynthesis C-methylase UbiE